MLNQAIITRDEAQVNVKKEKYAYKHDKKAQEPSYDIGDQAWVYTNKTPVRMSQKSHNKWTEPYYICKTYGNYTYKLRSCSNHKAMQSVIHASRLKLFFDPEDRPTNPPVGIKNKNALKVDIDPQTVKDADKTGSHVNDQQPPPDPQQSPDTQQPPDTQQHSDPQTREKEDLRITCLLRASRHKGQRVYFVKWEEKDKRSTWENADNIPPLLIQECHIKKTMSGEGRKR